MIFQPITRLIGQLSHKLYTTVFRKKLDDSKVEQLNAQDAAMINLISDEDPKNEASRTGKLSEKKLSIKV